ncbi:hypothetical protein ACSYGO_43130 [Streptomyces krungchingensis]
MPSRRLIGDTAQKRRDDRRPRSPQPAARSPQPMLTDRRRTPASGEHTADRCVACRLGELKQ